MESALWGSVRWRFSDYMKYRMVDSTVFSLGKLSKGGSQKWINGVVMNLPTKPCRSVLISLRVTLNPSKNIQVTTLEVTIPIGSIFAKIYRRCEKENKRAVCEWVYRKIFNEQYNLTFGRYVPPTQAHVRTHAHTHTHTPSYLVTFHPTLKLAHTHSSQVEDWHV